MNRRINGGQTDLNWEFNGPNDILSTWDGIGRRMISINSFTDGTSTHGDLQRVGQRPRRRAAQDERSRDGLLSSGQAQSNSFPTDLQFAQSCQADSDHDANQAQGWKGEWWTSGAEHDLLAHELAESLRCEYHDQNVDWRATITLQNASSMHPGGVNVLFMDGSVRFVKSSVNWQPWYAIATPDGNEAFDADQL